MKMIAILLLAFLPISSSAQEEDTYFVRSRSAETYIIEHKGHRLTARCRETLSWLDGEDKPGRTMSEHECTYMSDKVGQHVSAEFWLRQGSELRFMPWHGIRTLQTADVLDITDDTLLGEKSKRNPPRTSPEIVRTLRWMQNTLNNEEGKTLYMDQDGKDDTRVNLMPEMDGCVVTFVYEKRSDRKATYRVREHLNLADLDPTTISANAASSDIIGAVSIVTAATTDSASAIIMFVGDRAATPAIGIPTTDLLWELPSPYATRFVKALKHAVVLCGGRKSAF